MAANPVSGVDSDRKIQAANTFFGRRLKSRRAVGVLPGVLAQKTVKYQ
jgi:hypothetical protein